MVDHMLVVMWYKTLRILSATNSNTTEHQTFECFFFFSGLTDPRDFSCIPYYLLPLMVLR